MKYTALVPVKALGEAKSRLASYMTQAQRASLMLDMLQHVLCTLRSSGVFAHISVVSPDRRVLQYAQNRGAIPLLEEQPGHNPALTTAALHESAQGVDALLTISADLPLLTTYDIHSLIEQSQRYEVVLAASQEGTGTNALLTHPPLVLPYVFGPGSLQEYQVQARQRQLCYTIHSSRGLSFDIDTIDDVETLYDEIDCRTEYMVCCG